MKIIITIALILLAGFAQAKDVYVNGYTKSNGTYVEPHHRSAPDNNPYNNYSTKGNVNPYTGQEGHVIPNNNPNTYNNNTYNNPYNAQGNNYDNRR